jgi:hypothetical protein
MVAVDLMQAHDLLILGSARVLLELGPGNAALRAEMVEVLERAVVRLERVSLDPRSELAPGEQTLRPSPSLEREP